jgi:hypothetical protein
MTHPLCGVAICSGSSATVKAIRDKAEALRAYTKQAGESLEMQNWCAEIKIHAKRRAGQLLREIEKHPGAATRLRDATALRGELIASFADGPNLLGSDIHVMLILRRSPRQVVVTNK